ncbi:Prefoldin subunit [Entamoeba marina]
MSFSWWDSITSFFKKPVQQQETATLLRQASFKNANSHVLPLEYATTLTYSQMERKPITTTATNQTKLTIEKVYNEKKPKSPTESERHKRIIKIYTVLSEEKKKQLLRIIDPKNPMLMFNNNIKVLTM